MRVDLEEMFNAADQLRFTQSEMLADAAMPIAAER